MRYLVSILALSMTVTACASTSEPAGPDSASVVNPVIEQRIEERAAEGRGRGFPDIRDVRTAPDDLATPAQRAASQQALIAAAAQTEEEIAIQRQRADDAALAARVEALKARIAHDRALAEAEGSLADRAEELR
ncbi:hypothetical protein [Parvularcula sp. LCG005]|uniref:hypothetical protein n=1 Tax=Parvularcula sp. LCG005 TaxID=3078805 RepID=UPI002943926F|nr:hypothetical protein [Parvularcula sp. LCG005]WOI54696.1 hypothetical protein RUI03_06755 [Parvularcula sp. LCG005]